MEDSATADALVREVERTFAAVYVEPSAAIDKLVEALDGEVSWDRVICFFENNPRALGNYLGNPTGVERQEAFRAARNLLEFRSAGHRQPVRVEALLEAYPSRPTRGGSD